MAAIELVVISSSPSAQVEWTTGRDDRPQLPFAAKSTSTSIPRSKTKYSTGSGASPIPDGAVTGFRSANTLVKETGLALSTAVASVDALEDATTRNDSSSHDGARAIAVCEKEPSKKRPAAKRTDDPKLKLDKKPVQRKSKKKPIEDERSTLIQEVATALNETQVLDQKEVTAKVAKPRKPRKIEDPGEPQTRIKKGKVTKPGLATTPDIKKFKLPPGLCLPPPTITTEPDLTIPTSAAQLDPATVAHVDLALEPASRRRAAWTPPRDTVTLVECAINSQALQAEGNPTAETCEDESVALPTAFLDLKGSFGYNGQTSRPVPPTASRTNEGESLAKRRRIEVVEAKAAKVVPAVVAKKVKPPAKSTRTITSIAVAHFQSPEKDSLGENTTSAFFAPRPRTESSHDVPDAAGQLTVMRKPKKKVSDHTSEAVPVKRKTKAKSNKKVVEPAPTLLSPSTALRRLNRQEILYGTSSQLVREESPSYIRDLQQALKESEMTVADDDPSYVLNLDHRQIQSEALPISGRGLWGAGIRDEGDALLSPELPRRERRDLSPMKDVLLLPMSDISFADIDDIEKAIEERDTGVCAAPAVPSVQVHELKEPKEDAASPPSAQPRFFQFTSNVVEPKSALQCTEGSPQREGLEVNARILQSLDTNLKLSNTATNNNAKPDVASKPKISKPRKSAKTAEEGSITALKRPRGRPPKNLSATDALPDPAAPAKRPRKTTKNKAEPATMSNPRAEQAWTNIDEIEDSEPEPTPSPPRRRSLLPPAALQLSQPIFAESEVDKVAVAQARLFQQITTAIKAAPRTTDLARPSWYEKILMYDPIVLEDLAAWLNGGALAEFGGRVEEVDVKAAVVQKWCEENSVCCLWREGLRGGVKAHY